MANSMNALLSIIAIMVIADVATSTNYTVGAPNGSWDLSTNYTRWVSNNTFYTGDYLIFSYTSSHDVAEVLKSDYESCSGNSPIYIDKSGKTVFELKNNGTRYFICSVGNHCINGMHVEIKVMNSSFAPLPPPSPKQN